MITMASNSEIQYILSNAKDVANEGAVLDNVISQEQAVEIALAVLDQGGYYLVYRTSHQMLAGWILIGETMDFLTGKTHAFLYELYVLPEYRNLGIAKQLMHAAMRNCKRRGYEEVRLNVFANNFAKDLYERIGFEDLQTVMYKKL
ncbi:GNAT family N-acetyltransferase [Gracilibacillus sp. YIM 98692]|uniref:GNAT family N-acetyltransferase n=1 Tax=Gracilibacillus sp. YIM 98692 TaxID=2663532 RepID=UPI0013D5319E|nr:GNAT family N-acetyltransferase [Gracilibacillus sp. YIM 98692]